MVRDKYPIARERITKIFGSLSRFSKLSEIPKASIVRVLNGTYGQDDSRQRERIEKAMHSHGASPEEVRNLWAEVDISGGSATISLNGRRLRITSVMEIEDLGEIRAEEDICPTKT